jgi:hypothetical protein
MQEPQEENDPDAPTNLLNASRFRDAEAAKGTWLMLCLGGGRARIGARLQPPKERAMRTMILAAALVACLACSDASGLDTRSFTMSFATNSSGSAQTSAQSAASVGLSDITITEGANTLVITRARLVLDEIELEEFSGRDCDNSGSGRDPNCPEIELGPFLVDLPLTGGVRSAISAQIPAGSYHEIEFDVEPVDDSNAGARAFFAAHPDVPRNRSIMIEGTFNGQRFEFTSASRFELELEFEPNLVVGAGGTADAMTPNPFLS